MKMRKKNVFSLFLFEFIINCYKIYIMFNNKNCYILEHEKNLNMVLFKKKNFKKKIITFYKLNKIK
jgi:hypothetical protein